MPRARRAVCILVAGIFAAPFMVDGTAGAQVSSAPVEIWQKALPDVVRESSPMAATFAGSNNVVVGSLDGRVWAVRPDGSDVGGWPRDLGEGISSTPAIADVEGDGTQDIFVGSGTPYVRGGKLFRLREDASSAWEFQPRDGDFPSLSMFSSPALGDVNGDGGADVSGFSLGLLGWSFNVGGGINPGWPFYQDDTIFSSPALFDVDRDGKTDYVVGGDQTAGGPVDHEGGMLRAIRGDGSLIWDFRIDEIIRSSPAIGDVDGDGEPEIVVGTGDSRYLNPTGTTRNLYVLRRDGTVKWVKDLGAATPSSPTLADFNNDGRLDIAMATFGNNSTSKVWVLDGVNGAEMPGFTGGKPTGGGPVIGQITTADFNGDGSQDLLVPTGAGIWAYSGDDGIQLFTLMVGQNTGYQNAPLVTDLDGDARLDIIVAGGKTNNTGVITRYEMPDTTANLGSRGWHQFRKDNRHTGSYVPTNLYVDYCASNPGESYLMAARDGGVFGFCPGSFQGSLGGQRLNQPVVGLARLTNRRGYWMVAADGGIFAFGDARFQGSTGNIRLNQPIVGMAATPSGNGYWLVAADGGIFAFGDARFQGSTGNIRLNQPIVGMAVNQAGTGYRLVARDGGIFAFDSSFLGSTGAVRLNQPIVALVS